MIEPLRKKKNANLTHIGRELKVEIVAKRSAEVLEKEYKIYKK